MRTTPFPGGILIRSFYRSPVLTRSYGADDPRNEKAIKSGRIFPLATASRDGEPNVAPMGAVYPRDLETIWIGNQFMKTTIRNVLENPRACLYVWGPGIPGWYKIKGDVEVSPEDTPMKR